MRYQLKRRCVILLSSHLDNSCSAVTFNSLFVDIIIFKVNMSVTLWLLEPRHSGTFSYGTFTQTNLDQTGTTDTALDKCWRQCERILMYLSSSAYIEREFEAFQSVEDKR